MRSRVAVASVVVLLTVLLGAPGAFAQTVGGGKVADLTTGGGGSLDGAFSGPKPTLLTNKEGGGDRQSGLMTRVNQDTFLVMSPGADRIWGTADDGVVHCFDVGGAGEGCEFITLGALQPELDTNNTNSVGDLYFDSDEDGTSDLFISRQDDSMRAPIKVNTSTAIVLGAGATNGVTADNVIDFATSGAILGGLYCEDRSAMNINGALGGGGAASATAFRNVFANDVIHVLRGLGAAGATVENLDTLSGIPDTFDVDADASTTAIDMGLCLGTHAADPIRINGNTIVFAQPGLDGYFQDSEACTDEGGLLNPDDLIVVIRGLGASSTTSTVEVLTLDGLTTNGVKLSGAPASRAVRTSKKSAVFASPGEDGEFADNAVTSGSSAGLCGGDNVENEDDGIIIVRGLGALATSATLEFVEVGVLSAEPESRPYAANEDPGTIVVLGPGPDHEMQEQECWNSSEVQFTANMCDPGVPSGEDDDTINVVSNTRPNRGAPVLSSFDGFGHMKRPVGLTDGKVVVLQERQGHIDETLPFSFDDFEQLVHLSAVLVKGLGTVASPTTKEFAIPIGDAIWHTKWHGAHGIRMNKNTLLFAVTGPFRVMAFNVGLGGEPPFFTMGPGADDEKTAIKLSRVNDNNAMYQAAKANRTGMLTITADGGIKDTWLATAAEHAPAAEWVRINDTTAATNAVDGAVYVASGIGAGTPTVAMYPGCWSGAPGCRVLRLSDTALALPSPGVNLQFDANNEQGGCSDPDCAFGSADDDELIWITGLP